MYLAVKVANILWPNFLINFSSGRISQKILLLYFSFGSVRAEILLRFKPSGSHLIDKITAAATRGVIHNLNVDPSSFKSFEIGMKFLTHSWRRSLYHIETSMIIGSANQWTGFYMIGTSVMKEFKQPVSSRMTRSIGNFI